MAKDFSDVIKITNKLTIIERLALLWPNVITREIKKQVFQLRAKESQIQSIRRILTTPC
jgi:hypothetical protein